jgi:hypothetical protein
LNFSVDGLSYPSDVTNIALVESLVTELSQGLLYAVYFELG